MGPLKVIDGSKRAKRMAEARILECRCGSRTFTEARTGIALDKAGKVLHKGTLTRLCAKCGEPV